MFLNFFLFHSLEFNNTCINLNSFSENETGYFNISNSYLIENCYFERLNTFVERGGVFYFYNIFVDLIIKSTIFFSCSSLKHGGAIYLNSIDNKSSYQFFFSCAYECYSHIYHMFGYFHLSGNSTNEINQLSLIKCYKENTNGNEIIFLVGSIQNVNFLNSSNHKVNSYSAFLTQNPLIFRGNFWTINNNTANSFPTIYLYLNYNNILKYINIVSNNVGLNGIIYHKEGNYSFLNSVFYLNKGNLFFSTNGYLEIINCMINHNELILTGNGILITQYINLNNNTLQISHFSTYYCKNNVENLYITCNIQSFKYKFSILSYFYIL